MATPAADSGESMNKTVGRRIHVLMWDRKITQTQLARQMGMTQAGLSKKLKGDRGWDADDLVRVAAQMNVTVGELFGEPRSPETVPPTNGGGSECAARESNPQPAD